MHPDHHQYFRHTTRSRLDKSLKTLAGIIEGIALDGKINAPELAYLSGWIEECSDVRDRHPFNELLPVVEEALRDGVLTEDEKADILWLCDKLSAEGGFYDQATGDMQRLHGILCGIMADGVVTEDELRQLSIWLDDHSHLASCWPYDEICSIVTAVMADHKIDEGEQQVLQSLFTEFMQIDDDRTISNPLVLDDGRMAGLCAVCPDISFSSACFCFTGASSRYKRSELQAVVERLGGTFAKNVTKSVDYLVVGADGNPCWAYSCYGRKVEAAVRLRKEGHGILLVHENDFHDAVSDQA